MKKYGFSYLELIICMALVVMVVILSTPYLTHVETPPASSFGMFVCYAYFDKEQNKWVLKYNEKRNSSEYVRTAAKEVSNDTGKCKFSLPKGVSVYNITLYGGAGAGGSAAKAGENFKLCNNGEVSSAETMQYKPSSNVTSIHFGLGENCDDDGCIGYGGELSNPEGQQTKFKNTVSYGGSGGSCSSIIKCDTDDIRCTSNEADGEDQEFDFNGLEPKGGIAGKVDINSSPVKVGKGGRGSGGAIIVEWGN